MHIKSYSDFFGGLTLVVIAVIAFVALADLPAGSAGEMGPAYIPRALAGGLAIIGLGQIIYAMLRGGPAVGHIPVRPIAVVLVAIAVFAVGIERLGLLLSSFLLLAVASLALPGQMEWRAAGGILLVLIIGAIAATLLFSVALGLPMPALPRF